MGGRWMQSCRVGTPSFPLPLLSVLPSDFFSLHPTLLFSIPIPSPPGAPSLNLVKGLGLWGVLYAPPAGPGGSSSFAERFLVHFEPKVIPCFHGICVGNFHLLFCSRALCSQKTRISPTLVYMLRFPRQRLYLLRPLQMPLIPLPPCNPAAGAHACSLKPRNLIIQPTSQVHR